jgi:hypothetical protein
MKKRKAEDKGKKRVSENLFLAWLCFVFGRKCFKVFKYNIKSQELGEG